MAEITRTDEEVMCKAPIKAMLGETEYEIKPLPILKQRAWRDNLFKQIGEIGSSMSVDSNNPMFLKSMAFIFLQFPEKMADLVFSYAPSLPKDKILEEATEEQIVRVFSHICQVAFPFVAELRMMQQTMGTAMASFPQSVKSTKLQ